MSTPLGRIGPRLEAPPTVKFKRPPRAELWAFIAGALAATACFYAWLVFPG